MIPCPAPETRQVPPSAWVDRYALISYPRGSSKSRELRACLCLATGAAPVDHDCGIPSTQTGGHCTTLANLCASLPPVRPPECTPAPRLHHSWTCRGSRHAALHSVICMADHTTCREMFARSGHCDAVVPCARESSSLVVHMYSRASLSRTSQKIESSTTSSLSRGVTLCQGILRC